MKALIAALWLALGAQTAPAQQGWGDIGTLLVTTLSDTGTAESTFWLPDTPDPATARTALGVAYVHIPGSAGSVSLSAGMFQRQQDGWGFAGRIGELYGFDPRDPLFAPSYVEVTTTMPGPNDPRCCPTLEARWRVDYTRLTAVRLD